MAVQPSQVFSPSNFQELFTLWNRFPDAVLYAGGTEFVRSQGIRVPILPRVIISLGRLDDICRVSRTERYLEIGAMVRLNQIINMGKIVPEPLTRCLECIGGPQLRNLATIGGNICNSSLRHDSSAAMIALDAQYELRSAQAARWISASRFTSLRGHLPLKKEELLTRIRVPLEPWTFTKYRRLHSPGNNSSGGGIIFIIKNQRNILTSIRAAYSGRLALRDRSTETMLEGKRLPLDRRDAAGFAEKWKSYLAGIAESGEAELNAKDDILNAEMLITQINNFIETAIYSISD